MRPKLIFLCFISSITAAVAETPGAGDQAPEPLTLDAVTAAVLANNPSIRGARPFRT